MTTDIKGSSLPALEAFEPKAPDFMMDPYPYYAALRAEAPVYRHPDSGVVFVTTYVEAQTVLRDPETYSALVDRVAMREGGLPEQVLEIKTKGWPTALTLSANDAPSHDDYKAIVHPFFMPRALAEKTGEIQSRIDGLIGQLKAAGDVDFVTAYSVPLPIAVIVDYLGLSDYGYDQMKTWSDAVADEIGFLTSDDRAIEIAEMGLALQHAIVDTAKARRDDPRDDIISHLTHARMPGGKALDEPEILSLVTQLLVAGNETTTNTLSAGIVRLATSPELAGTLRSDPKLIPRFVEELLRLESPVQGQFRKATRDTELSCVALQAGDLLHIRYASANRDEEAFGPSSDQINLENTPPKQHMSFGMGLHFCVGAMLSRLELRLSFESLLSTFDQIELTVPKSQLTYPTHFHLRGLASVPVRLS